MPRVTVPGAELEVLDEGYGPPIVFVHGFPLDHSMWQGQIEHFRATHRVIVPDLRGFGASSVSTGTVEMSTFADDVAAVLTALGVQEPVVYCGLSMGGYIGWEFVRRHGDRLRALVVCDSRAADDTDEARQNRARMAESVLASGPRAAVEAMLPKLFSERSRREHPERVDALRAVMLGTDPEAIAAALRGMAARPDSRPLLGEIAVPSLYLCGEDDLLTPADEMAEMANATPNASYVAIPERGHMAPLEDPAAANAALAEFLDELA